MKIYFVTKNAGKVEEFRRILKGKINLEHLKPDKEIPELEIQDVREVVIDKSKKAAEIYKKTVLTEDTGLFIKTLNGFPGSLIDRETKKHEESFRYWCGLLNKTNAKDRSAYAETAIAVCKPGKKIAVYVGRIDGHIPEEPMIGEHGFGWDSIFVPNGYNKSFAQLETEIKDNISMRRMALNKLLKDIKKLSRMLNEDD